MHDRHRRQQAGPATSTAQPPRRAAPCSRPAEDDREVDDIRAGQELRDRERLVELLRVIQRFSSTIARRAHGSTPPNPCSDIESAGTSEKLDSAGGRRRGLRSCVSGQRRLSREPARQGADLNVASPRSRMPVAATQASAHFNPLAGKRASVSRPASNHRTALLEVAPASPFFSTSAPLYYPCRPARAGYGDKRAS